MVQNIMFTYIEQNHVLVATIYNGAQLNLRFACVASCFPHCHAASDASSKTLCQCGKSDGFASEQLMGLRHREIYSFCTKEMVYLFA
jgi:hypothetical protein